MLLPSAAPAVMSKAHMLRLRARLRCCRAARRRFRQRGCHAADMAYERGQIERHEMIAFVYAKDIQHAAH